MHVLNSEPVYFSLYCENLQYETKWSRETLTMILWFCLFFLKKERKYWIHSLLNTRQDEGEFHLLIKELWNYPDRSQVYFRMSVVQFDTLLAILKPHLKKWLPISVNRLILNSGWQYVWSRDTHRATLQMIWTDATKNAENQMCSQKIMTDKSLRVSV